MDPFLPSVGLLLIVAALVFLAKRAPGSEVEAEQSPRARTISKIGESTAVLNIAVAAVLGGALAAFAAFKGVWGLAAIGLVFCLVFSVAAVWFYRQYKRRY